jgi:hypothetical protein
MIGRNTSLAIFVTALAVLGGRTPAAAADAAGQPVWELRPYRVQVFVGVAAGLELSGQLPTALARRLAERIPALQGGAWEVTVSPAPPGLQQAMAASLAGVTADALPKSALEADKVILLRVATAAGGYEVAAREFDVATGLWSAAVARPVAQVLKLPDRSLAVIFEAFAPLAWVSAVKDHEVLLRLRASALTPHDLAIFPIKAGGVFRLVVRGVAKGDSARPATPIPWTFCTVQQVGQEELRGRLETGLRDPLGDRWETSMEVLALGVVPPRQASLLTLKSTARPAEPLPGYEVYASTAAGNPVLLGRTDRQGSLRIAPSGSPLQVLLVRHGDEWLARLPMVPGLEPQLSLAVAPDEYGIEREGVLAGARDAAMDLAARRELLIRRLKACIAAERLDEAETLLKELRQLPTPQDLLAAPAAGLKKLSGEAASQGKADTALADFQKVLTAQFDAKAVDDLAAGIEKRKAAAHK